MTDPIPDWFEKLFAERMEVAVDRVALARTTEELWAAKGQISAFRDLKNEIEMVKQQAAQAEKQAAEGWTRTDA